MDCAFCDRIARGDYRFAPAWEVARFEPLNPVTPGHMLFVPESHVESAAEKPSVAGDCVRAAAKYAQKHLPDLAYNIITSHGVDATQSVFHLHVHLVPRRPGDGLTLPWTGQHAAKETFE